MDESKLEECLAEASSLDNVLAQCFLNTAYAITENALLMRSLLPGGEPEPLTDRSSPGIARMQRAKRRRGLKKADEIPSAKKKRKTSGYVMYTSSIRPEVKAHNPSLGPAAMMSELAARWKDLTKEQQTVWNVRANTDATDGDGGTESEDN